MYAAIYCEAIYETFVTGTSILTSTIEPNLFVDSSVIYELV
jgi:hypothetical protein